MQCTGSAYVVEPQSGFLELLLIAHVPSFMTLLSFHGRQFGSLFEAPSERVGYACQGSEVSENSVALGSASILQGLAV